MRAQHFFPPFLQPPRPPSHARPDGCGHQLTRSSSVKIYSRYSCFDDETNTLRKRLHEISPGTDGVGAFTEKKLTEFTSEFPSKRLLLIYVDSFESAVSRKASIEALAQDLWDHFIIMKQCTRDIAEALFGMLDTDIETGICRGFVRKLLKDREAGMHKLARENMMVRGCLCARGFCVLPPLLTKPHHCRQRERAAALKSDEHRRKRIADVGSAERAPPTDDELDAKELTTRRLEEEEARFKLDKATKEHRMADGAVRLTLSRMEAKKMHVIVNKRERVAWMERYVAAKQMPELTADDQITKYTEMKMVGRL